MLLQKFEERAIQAHNWTSFDPERRGKNLVREFSAQLENDIEQIKKAGIKHSVPEDVVSGSVSRYVERYERHFSAWIGAKSNCISSMITGPARFPTRKAEKANNSERAKYEFLQSWREKCLNAICRGFAPKVTPLTELQKAQSDLQSCKRNHEIMKAANVVIRKAKRQDCTAALVEIGLSEDAARNIQSPDCFGGYGFAQFTLTNNLANIKRLEIRVRELEAKAALHAAGVKNEQVVNGVRIVHNFEEDRLQLIFDGRPAPEVITALKKSGFKWSPRFTAWQRKLTGNAQFAAKHILNNLN